MKVFCGKGVCVSLISSAEVAFAGCGWKDYRAERFAQCFF